MKSSVMLSDTYDLKVPAGSACQKPYISAEVRNKKSNARLVFEHHPNTLETVTRSLMQLDSFLRKFAQPRFSEQS